MNTVNKTLNETFKTIIENKIDIENILCSIKTNIDKLDIIYDDYFKEINDKIVYNGSLDTFNFQTKLINIEYNNNMNVLNIFLNRMYGDYYKLYKKIVEYVNTEIPRDEKINDSNYPTYKDLDISKKYSFNIIQKIFIDILSILNENNNYIIKENNNIKEIQNKQDNGLNINNFLNEKKFSLIIIEQKNNLYYEILKGDVSFQNKFLKRLYFKLKIFYTQIDINLETDNNNSNNIIKNEQLNIKKNNFSKYIYNFTKKIFTNLVETQTDNDYESDDSVEYMKFY